MSALMSDYIWREKQDCLEAEIARLRERVEKLEAEVGECAWKEDYDGNWETSCNEIFIIMEGTPEENSMRYCTYCGKKLVAVRAALGEVERGDD